MNSTRLIGRRWRIAPGRCIWESLGNGLSFACKTITGNIKWTYQTSANLGSGLVINSKGDIITSLIYYAVVCLSRDGRLKWERVFYGAYDDVAPAPLIIKNDNIIYALKDEYVLMDTAGNILTKAKLPGDFAYPSFQIDKEGNLYGLTFQHCFFSITQSGELRWVITVPDTLDDVFSAFWWALFEPSGEALIVPGYKFLFKINRVGVIENYKKITLGSPLLVTYDGRIICYDAVDSAVICLSTENMMEIWRYKDKQYRILQTTQPSVLPDGTVVIPVSIYPDHYPGLLALDSQGKRLWMKTLPGFANTWITLDLITTSIGNILSSPCTSNLVMVDKYGVIQWQISQQHRLFTTPALGENTFYIGDYAHGIYAIE